MESVGFRHLLAVEIDRRACATLRVNGAEDYAESEPLPSSGGDGWPLAEGDIRAIDLGRWRAMSAVELGRCPQGLRRPPESVAGAVPVRAGDEAPCHRGRECEGPAAAVVPRLLRVHPAGAGRAFRGTDRWRG